MTKPLKQQPKALRPLTRKQQIFVKHLIDNPKASATESAQVAYAVANRNTARSIATENLSKPAIQLELSKYSGRAEHNLMLIADKSTELGLEGNTGMASISERVNNSILDRVHGKATTVIEQSVTGVTLNIDLSGAITEVDS